jgi:very-short-patch-repair endonuclease
LKPAIGGLLFEPPNAIGDALRKQFQAEECRMPADGRRDPNRIQFARIQRRTSNDFARTVWSWLRNRQMFGQKFRREYPIPPYTADFCCPELLLVIEVDGSEHMTDAGQQSDCVRDEFLFRQGYRVLRIPGYDVFKDESSVITRIRNFVSASVAAKQSE